MMGLVRRENRQMSESAGLAEKEGLLCRWRARGFAQWQGFAGLFQLALGGLWYVRG